MNMNMMKSKKQAQTSNKFKIGDLVTLPKGMRDDPDNDYGIIAKIDQYKNYCYYHIHWAIDCEITIEPDEWVEENIDLVQRA